MEGSEGGKCQDKLVSDRADHAGMAPAARRKTTDARSTTVETRLRRIRACLLRLNQIRSLCPPEDNNKLVVARASTGPSVGAFLLGSIVSSLKDRNSQIQQLMEDYQLSTSEDRTLEVRTLEDRNRTTVTSSSKEAAL